MGRRDRERGERCEWGKTEELRRGEKGTTEDAESTEVGKRDEPRMERMELAATTGDIIHCRHGERGRNRVERALISPPQ